MQTASREESPGPVVTVIGAGSTTFGPKFIRDMLNHPALDCAEYRFCDIDRNRLRIMEQLATRLGAHRGQFAITTGTDRRSLLPGSDVVLINVDSAHYTTWEQDYRIPVEAGSRQVFGELGGIGGFFHSLRQVPLHEEIGQDILQACPDALVLIASNPLNRICYALREKVGLERVVGLCHGTEMAEQLFLPRLLDLPGDRIETTSAGTNHLTWILGLRDRETGADLLPELDRALNDPAHAGFQPMSRWVYHHFGYYPATGDSHAGEYLPFARDLTGEIGPDFADKSANEAAHWSFLERAARGDIPLDAERPDDSRESEELRLQGFFDPRSWADTLVFPLLNALHGNQPTRMAALNLPNRGIIPELPDDVFIEVPAYVDPAGIHPFHCRLPEACAAWNRRDCDQLRLTVEAALTGDRRTALLALSLDPVADPLPVIEKAFDALLAEQAAYLPRFQC
jgi:alpha-galactosidase